MLVHQWAIELDGQAQAHVVGHARSVVERPETSLAARTRPCQLLATRVELDIEFRT